ncbi:polyamine aminopropyltransferase [Devosia sp. A369]
MRVEIIRTRLRSAPALICERRPNPPASEQRHPEFPRRYFNLPDEVACHVADGRDFLRDNPARYDAIVMDAYVGAFVPQHLRSMSFFRLAHTRLDEARGQLIANVFTEHDFDEAPDDAATAMGESGATCGSSTSGAGSTAMPWSWRET